MATKVSGSCTASTSSRDPCHEIVVRLTDTGCCGADGEEGCSVEGGLSQDPFECVPQEVTAAQT